MSTETKCAPENCPALTWATMSEAERITHRKREARRLEGQGFSQQAIAAMFGVSQKTISKDLDEGVYTTGINSKRTSKRGRKGEGRPKGKRQVRRRSAPTPEVEQKMAQGVLDEGKTLEEVTREFGLPSVQHAKLAVAREEVRREPRVERSDLSMTAQEKVEAWKRQEKRKLEGEFEERVLEECRRRLNELSLPSYLQQLKDLERSITGRKGVMDGSTYKKILACLHPDRLIGLLKSTEDERPRLLHRYEEAFRLFSELEKRVLDEKESPTQFRRDIPRTYEELMAAREKVRAANRDRAMRATRRGSGPSALRPR